MRADETRDDDVPPRGAPRSDSSSASSETSAVSSSAAEEEDEAAAAAAAVISPSPSSTSSSRSSSSCSAASAAAGPGGEEDLPYPGFVPVALYYFHQDRPPRSCSCLFPVRVVSAVSTDYPIPRGRIIGAPCCREGLLMAVLAANPSSARPPPRRLFRHLNHRHRGTAAAQTSKTAVCGLAGWLPFAEQADIIRQHKQCPVL
ncbi:hypothetical protein MTO96_029017 [Rhipicephalus appendiculatus]